MVTDAEPWIAEWQPSAISCQQSVLERSPTAPSHLAFAHASIDRTSSGAAGVLCRSRDGDQSVDLDGPDL